LEFYHFLHLVLKNTENHIIVFILLIFAVFVTSCGKAEEDVFITIEINSPYSNAYFHDGDTIELKAKILASAPLSEIKVFISKETNVPLSEVLILKAQTSEYDLNLIYIIAGDLTESGTYKLQVNAVAGKYTKTSWVLVRIEVPKPYLKRIWVLTAEAGNLIGVNNWVPNEAFFNRWSVTGEYSGAFVSSKSQLIGVSTNYSEGLRTYNTLSGLPVWQLPSTVNIQTRFISGLYFKEPYLFLSMPAYQSIRQYSKDGMPIASFPLHESHIPGVIFQHESWLMFNEARPGQHQKRLKTCFYPGGAVANEYLHQMEEVFLAAFDPKSICIFGKNEQEVKVLRYFPETNESGLEKVLTLAKIYSVLPVSDSEVLVAHSQGIGRYNLKTRDWISWVTGVEIKLLALDKNESLVYAATSTSLHVFAYPQGQQLALFDTQKELLNVLLEFNR